MPDRGLSIESPWSLHRISMVSPWSLHRKSIENPSNLHGGNIDFTATRAPTMIGIRRTELQVSMPEASDLGRIEDGGYPARSTAEGVGG